MRCELYLKRKKNKWMSKCLLNQSKLITQEIRVCLIPRGAQMWVGWCPSENLKRRQGHWRGSEAEDNSALGPVWPIRGCTWVPGGPGKNTVLPAGLWPLGIPWDSSNCVCFTFGPAHYLQRLVKYTDFPGGLGAIPTNKRALRWKPELSLRGVFLCSLPGPPIHMNGGSWRPVSLPSHWTLLGRLWRINKVSFNQSVNWPDSICTACFLSAQSALCE